MLIAFRNIFVFYERSNTMAESTKTKRTRRMKGEGTIFQNSRGTWTARFSMKGYPTKEFTGKTKTEAKSKLDQYKILIATGNINTMKLTLGEYSLHFLFYKSQQVNRKTLKQTTYDRLEAVFNSFIKDHVISNVLMCNLRPTDIQNLIDELQPNYSFSTIKKVYLFIHSMVKHGMAQKDFPENYDPFVTVELPDETAVGKQTKKIEILPQQSLEDFKQVALSRNPDGTLAYRYGPALVFALNTGLRKGELLALSKNNIITDKEGRKLIHITETVSCVKNREKNASTSYTQIITPPKYPRSNRRIPLNQEAEMCLEIMLNSYEPNTTREDLIISTQNGNIPMHRRIQDTMDKILKRIGEKHYGTHATRHTFATMLLSKTASHQDIKAVAEILGDDYKVVLKTYLHTDDEKKHNLVDLLIG